MILYIIKSFCEQLSVNVFPIHAHAVTRLSVCGGHASVCCCVSISLLQMEQKQPCRLFSRSSFLLA